MEEKIDKNSMLFWYPMVKDLPIPQPETHILKLEEDPFDLDKYSLEGWIIEDAKKFVAETKLSYPLFLRTDQSSGKHCWQETCFVKSEDFLGACIFRVIEENIYTGLMGLPYKALVFREFIPLESDFTAFLGAMPVSKERRYFVNNGKVVCHHHYWIEDAIRRPSIENWKEVLEELNTETPHERILLTGYAEMVGAQFPEYWSIDFAKTRDASWILIDMAVGTDSWHPE
jgi:hypothetical protein